MIALIDADIVLHRVGYTTNDESEGIARARVDDMLDGILIDTEANEFQLWLSDARDNTFRAKLWEGYKANRTAPRPLHYDIIKEHMIREYGARIAHQMEADDALGIHQDKSGSETVICSIDKDLLQIPGLHYNFVKNQWNSVTKWEGLVWFYQQILIGDSSDNIQGCRGIGPVKAQKILGSIPPEKGEEELLFETVKTYYRQEESWSPEKVKAHILLTGRLLKIKQTEDEDQWHFPVLNPMQVQTLLSILNKREGNTQSTVPITQEAMSGSVPHGQARENISKADPRD